MPSALSDLRRTRRSRRLGDTEWFDLAYRVYLAGIFGGSAIIIASDAIGDTPLGASATADVFAYGPAVLGMVAVISLVVGLRSGAQGGPVSIEAADARHLLLAPIPRATVLRGPLTQRFRAVVSGAMLAGGVTGLLAAQRLPGSSPAWVFSGAAFGACIGVIVVGGATVAHAAGLRDWQAIAPAVILIGWQGWAIGHRIGGPADTLGSLALWGYRQHMVDWVGVAAVACLLAAAFVFVGRLRVEPLVRRGDLVSQLRFAVTTQDLRTVVLLRRQLRQEQPRANPWINLPARPGGATSGAMRRSLHGLMRTPAARIGRIFGFAIVAGIAAGATARGTTPAVAVCGIALMIMGLDLIEPLSQELDHPDRTEALPCTAGWLHTRLLSAPLLAAVAPAMAGAAACTAIAPRSAGAAFALALPITWSGMSGSVLNAVREQQTGPSDASMIVPPEMAGFGDLIKMGVPVILSSIGPLTILAVRSEPGVPMVLRSLIALMLFLAAMRWWITRRVAIRKQWQTFVAGARP